MYFTLRLKLNKLQLKSYVTCRPNFAIALTYECFLILILTKSGSILTLFYSCSKLLEYMYVCIYMLLIYVYFDTHMYSHISVGAFFLSLWSSFLMLFDWSDRGHDRWWQDSRSSGFPSDSHSLFGCRMLSKHRTSRDLYPVPHVTEHWKVNTCKNVILFKLKALVVFTFYASKHCIITPTQRPPSSK